VNLDIFQAVYLLGNAGMFLYAFLKYKNGKEFFYLRLIVGVSIYTRNNKSCHFLNPYLPILFSIHVKFAKNM